MRERISTVVYMRVKVRDVAQGLVGDQQLERGLGAEQPMAEVCGGGVVRGKREGGGATYDHTRSPLLALVPHGSDAEPNP